MLRLSRKITENYTSRKRQKHPSKSSNENLMNRSIVVKSIQWKGEVINFSFIEFIELRLKLKKNAFNNKVLNPIYFIITLVIFLFILRMFSPLCLHTNNDKKGFINVTIMPVMWTCCAPFGILLSVQTVLLTLEFPNGAPELKQYMPHFETLLLIL